jgi:hypothetical protein
MSASARRRTGAVRLGNGLKWAPNSVKSRSDPHHETANLNDGSDDVLKWVLQTVHRRLERRLSGGEFDPSKDSNGSIAPFQRFEQQTFRRVLMVTAAASQAG